MTTRIIEATINDAEAIQQLAEAVWWPTYSPILSEDQIKYMLSKMYDIDTIKEQINTQSQYYLLLFAEGILTGFAAYSPREENATIYKLHKLYCLTTTKGKGYGKLLLQAVEAKVKESGNNTLELNVNRYNPALNFYGKMGFAIAYTEDIEIGNGYQMNDYVMRKIL